MSSASIPLDASATKEKPDEAMAEKTVQIMSACHDKDLNALISLAASAHGLVNDSLRRTACKSLFRLHYATTNPNRAHTVGLRQELK